MKISSRNFKSLLWTAGTMNECLLFESFGLISTSMVAKLEQRKSWKELKK
jgi:hypothetical protein